MTLLNIEKNKCKLKKLKTLYIGGGTPSALPTDVMTSIINLIRKRIGFDPKIEITIEVNPEPIGQETVLAAIAAGANRISLGFQAKQNHLLKKIGRLHTYEDFQNILKLIRKSGVDNISCDLMFGLPGQSLSDALDSARTLIELQIPHISFYSLTLEKGTLFYKKYYDFPELLPSDDLERAMNRQLIDTFVKNGYEYYELSSCALTGYRSQHNYNYWTTKPYLGLGPSAHCYYNGIRKGNAPSLKTWLTDPTKNSEIEIVDNFRSMQEYAMLAFRMADGFAPSRFKERYQSDHPFEEEIDRLLKKELIYFSSIKKSYCLTDAGMDFGNQVFVEFI